MLTSIYRPEAEENRQYPSSLRIPWGKLETGDARLKLYILPLLRKLNSHNENTELKGEIWCRIMKKMVTHFTKLILRIIFLPLKSHASFLAVQFLVPNLSFLSFSFFKIIRYSLCLFLEPNSRFAELRTQPSGRTNHVIPGGILGILFFFFFFFVRTSARGVGDFAVFYDWNNIYLIAFMRWW